MQTAETEPPVASSETGVQLTAICASLLQTSLAFAEGVKTAPHCTLEAEEQEIEGASVSMTWAEQVAEAVLPDASVAAA